MTIRARVTQRGRSILVYLEDSTVPRAQLGPRGNFVCVNYDYEGKRVNHDAAIRGYGQAAGQDILQRALRLADRAAKRQGIGPATPRWDEVEIAKLPLP